MLNKLRDEDLQNPIIQQKVMQMLSQYLEQNFKDQPKDLYNQETDKIKEALRVKGIEFEVFQRYLNQNTSVDLTPSVRKKAALQVNTASNTERNN